MGCGKWKNWVILHLGAGFTWGAPIDRAQPQSKGEAKMCKQYRLNGMLLMALQKDSHHHPTTTLGDSTEICHPALHSEESQA